MSLTSSLSKSKAEKLPKQKILKTILSVLFSYVLGFLSCYYCYVFQRENIRISSSSKVQKQEEKISLGRKLYLDKKSKEEEEEENVWNIAPLEHSKRHHEFSFTKEERRHTLTFDTYTPFHDYMIKLSRNELAGKIGNKTSSSPLTSFNFPELPQFHTWPHFFEAYHNHFARFRGRDRVVFMEIGVQSGGKIPLLKNYFGPGLIYIGLDINPACQIFASPQHNIFIEIGNSANVDFLRSIKQKYPHVDIFLDDGGHFMQQQKIAFREMLPHVQPEGVYICEDLSTSWGQSWQGVPNADVRNKEFLQRTMIGLIHQTMDWLQAEYIRGIVMSPQPLETNRHFDDLNDDWWKIIPRQVKHIHYYNQLVVYEKGKTFPAVDMRTVGRNIPYMAADYTSRYAEAYRYRKPDWNNIMTKLKAITNSPWSL